MGFDSLGMEILPIGEFVLNARMALEEADTDAMIIEIEKIRKMNFEKYPISGKHDLRHITITKGAFPPETERALNGFLEYINKDVHNRTVKAVLKFAAFSILEAISYTRKDGQYLRWDKRSGRGKKNFAKGKIYSFKEALLAKLDQLLDIKKAILENNKNLPKITTGSCLTELSKLPNSYVDLVITSPPYCNRYDYTRTYALELVYLGVDETEIRRLRQAMLSCTVENKDKLNLLQQIYGQDKFTHIVNVFESQKALQYILSYLLKMKNEKKLNNPGIYSMVKNYFFEMSFVIFEISRILKSGGEVYFVNDNVRYAGCPIPVDLILSDIAEKAGLKTEKILVLAKGKGNSSQQMGTHGRVELRKCVYYWKKD